MRGQGKQLTWKYSSFNKMSPRRGRDIDHWFLQSSNMMIFKTVCSICWRISGLILTTATSESLSPELGLFERDFLPAISIVDQRLVYDGELITFVGHFLEEICDDMVQRGAAPSADHRI